ncbi:hypothetical protein EV121DRAFT_252482 [Schizophyllum commune]
MSAQNDVPLRTAHQHAANADELFAQGLIVAAMQEHSKAAESYAAAAARSNDEAAKRTLNLLYNEQRKTEKDLQRRIDKLKQDGKDPTLPQKPEPRPPPSSYMGPRSNPSPPSSTRPMSDSQNTVDESFMVLAGQRSDPGDAFNQFWNIMQGMLDNLSQPVAFATAPLESPDARSAHRKLQRDGSLSSDTDGEENMMSRLTKRLGMSRPSTLAHELQRPPANAYSGDTENDWSSSDDDSLSGSFLFIPSENEPTPLEKENAALKSALESMKQQVETFKQQLEARKQHEIQLRDSVYLATKEAHRLMGGMANQPPPPPPPQRAADMGSTIVNPPAVPPGREIPPGMLTGREAQYAKRVKELEDELKAAKAENEKQKASLIKYKEKWDKLKESARRKKEAKAAAGAVKQPIAEDPEGEERAEKEEGA